MTKQLTAIIEKEEDGYVALCPEVDVASQGDTIAETRKNLKEVLELFFENASLKKSLQASHKKYFLMTLKNNSLNSTFML